MTVFELGSWKYLAVLIPLTWSSGVKFSTVQRNSRHWCWNAPHRIASWFESHRSKRWCYLNDWQGTRTVSESDCNLSQPFTTSRSEESVQFTFTGTTWKSLKQWVRKIYVNYLDLFNPLLSLNTFFPRWAEFKSHQNNQHTIEQMGPHTGRHGEIWLSDD